MTDRRVFQSVVMFLGATLLLALVSIAVLTGIDKPAPGILENLAVGALTGLAGLLARQPSPDEPQSVTVVNQPGEPVPVEETG